MGVGLSRAQLEAVAAAISTGVSLEVACATAGVTSRAVRSLRAEAARDDASDMAISLARIVDVAEAGLERDALHVILSAAQAGDWRAAAWYLERRFARRWSTAAVERGLEAEIEVFVAHVRRVLGEEAGHNVLEAYIAARDGHPAPAGSEPARRKLPRH